MSEVRIEFIFWIKFSGLYFKIKQFCTNFTEYRGDDCQIDELMT